MALEPADETLGRYRLFGLLGRGGMAELHVARMTGVARVEKFVVIKRMLRHLVDDREFVAMFENEGRIAVRLEHPNVCQTYELDRVDGQLFLVMELVRGLPWSTVVNGLPQDELAASRFVVGLLTQACEGLHYSHHLTDADGRATPVVHRDVSPGNVMITNEGAIKLLDFGVSKLLNDDSATRAGMIKGKLPYMAPEQIRGELVDPRADIFSLGIMMWEALARRRLFDRASDLQIFKAIVEEPIPALPQTSPIMQRLGVVVRRALARDRNDRHPSARIFADELRDALAPFGAPMTQGEIQQAMSLWLKAPLAAAHQNLAAAISRLRAGDAPPVAAGPDEGRTSVDLIVGRAAETQVGRLSSPDADTVDSLPSSYAGADTDTEEEAPSSLLGGGEPTAIMAMRPEPKRTKGGPTPRPVVARDVRLPSEPSVTETVPTAPRQVVASTPRIDASDEATVSTVPTAPRPLPLRLPAPTESLPPTLEFQITTPRPRPVSLPPGGSWPAVQPGHRQPGAAPLPSGRVRGWVIALVVLSIAAGVFAAILSN